MDEVRLCTGHADHVLPVRKDWTRAVHREVSQKQADSFDEDTLVASGAEVEGSQ